MTAARSNKTDNTSEDRQRDEHVADGVRDAGYGVRVRDEYARRAEGNRTHDTSQSVTVRALAEAASFMTLVSVPVSERSSSLAADPYARWSASLPLTARAVLCA